MKKPYIICHMMTSIDGRIDCAMTSKLSGVSDYYATLDKINVPTTVSGSVWKGNPLYAESVLSVILEKIPDFALRPPLVEPVVGSVLCHGFARGIHDPDTLCRIAAAYPKPFLPCFSDGRMPQ